MEKLTIVNNIEQYNIIVDDIVKLINVIPHTKNYYTLDFLPWKNECTTYHLENGDNKIMVSFFKDEKINHYDIKYVDNYEQILFNINSENIIEEWEIIKNKLINLFL